MAEKYARAVRSSDLRVRETAGDVDVLVAAGWAREGLGTGLYRLRSEFDAVRADYLRARRVLAAGLDAAQAVGRLSRTAAAEAADDAARERSADLSRRAIAAAESAVTRAVSERFLLLSRLKSLAGVVERLDEYGRSRPTAAGLGEDALARTCAVALDVWLDSSCGACSGRGFQGGYGEPSLPCRPCRQTGRREPRFASAREAKFGRELLCDMDLKVSSVEHAMVRFLSRREKIRAGPLLPVLIRA